MQVTLHVCSLAPAPGRLIGKREGAAPWLLMGMFLGVRAGLASWALAQVHHTRGAPGPEARNDCWGVRDGRCILRACAGRWVMGMDLL